MMPAYQPELWRDLYVMLGTSAAALIGLLFVATSLHLDDIARNSVFHTRAYNQLRYLVVLLIEAVIVLVPQPLLFCGAELALLNLWAVTLPARNIYHFMYKGDGGGAGGWTLKRAYRYIAAMLLGAAGGAALIAQLYWGMYLVTLSYIALLVTVIHNAWLIMIGLRQPMDVVTRSAEQR